ncbi:unnamed protein product, partial [Prorocentrum cordatum]
MKNLLVTSVDASLHGFGVTACQIESSSVGKVGRVSERCRFRGELRKCSRPRGVLEDLEVPFSFLARGSDLDFLETGALTEFPEVPEWLAKDSPWCVIAAKRWRRKEKILNLEAEAALWAARYDPVSEHHAKYFYVSNPDGSESTPGHDTPTSPSKSLEAVIGDGVPHPPGRRRLAAAVPFAYGLPGLWEAAGGGQARFARGAGRARRRQARQAMRQAPSTLIGSAGRAAARLAELGFRASALGAASVTPGTQDTYLTHLEMLLRWLMLRQAPTLDKDEWDVLLASYIEHLYDSGATENAGGTTLAAVRWAGPAIPRPLRRGLPLASAALAGWRRAEPGRARLPMPRELAVAIALDLCDCGLPSLGFFAMLVFETYMRPSEALSLQRFQLAPPSGHGLPGTKGRWAVLIRALELGRPGKTGDFDGSVSLDLPRHQLLVGGLEEIFRRRGERDPVFLFDYVTLLRHWRATCKRLGLEHLHMTPYCLRHGLSDKLKEQVREANTLIDRENPATSLPWLFPVRQRLLT